MKDNEAVNETVPDISLPVNRKRCFTCGKLLYFHQPLLCCSRCRLVFHGACLKFTNENTFILQQFRWHCHDCNLIEPIIYSCETCFTAINVTIDSFKQCKQCFKILHKKCVTANVCLNCLPVDFEYDIPSVNSVNNDFYSQQPYFSPFDFLRKVVYVFWGNG